MRSRRIGLTCSSCPGGLVASILFALKCAAGRVLHDLVEWNLLLILYTESSFDGVEQVEDYLDGVANEEGNRRRRKEIGQS